MKKKTAIVSGLTKEEIRQRKEQRRREKALSKKRSDNQHIVPTSLIETVVPSVENITTIPTYDPVPEMTDGKTRWVVCLKWGNKYPSMYVNRLYNMVKRHMNVPFNFACITENSEGLDPHINVLPLPKIEGLKGWWYKPWVFSRDFPLKGTILFMDLDLVVINNIDCMWSYNPKVFCVIKDFARHNIKEWKKFNSSVFRFESGAYPHIWDNLAKNVDQTRRYHGDQDWLYAQFNSEFRYWPDLWLQSYKWEVRTKTDVVRVNGVRKFKNAITPAINPETKILVFHGDPKPENVHDHVIVKNWI